MEPESKERKLGTLETYTKTEVKFIPFYSAEENSKNITRAIHKAAEDSITKAKRTPMEHPWWNFKLEKLKKKKKKLQRQLTPKLKESDPDEFKRTKNRWNNTDICCLGVFLKE